MLLYVNYEATSLIIIIHIAIADYTKNHIAQSYEFYCSRPARHNYSTHTKMKSNECATELIEIIPWIYYSYRDVVVYSHIIYIFFIITILWMI